MKKFILVSSFFIALLTLTGCNQNSCSGRCKVPSSHFGPNPGMAEEAEGESYSSSY